MNIILFLYNDLRDTSENTTMGLGLGIQILPFIRGGGVWGIAGTYILSIFWRGTHILPNTIIIKIKNTSLDL